MAENLVLVKPKYINIKHFISVKISKLPITPEASGISHQHPSSGSAVLQKTYCKILITWVRSFVALQYLYFCVKEAKFYLLWDYFKAPH